MQSLPQCGGRPLAKSLSFHLAQLSRAGLVHGRQRGRFVIYTADFAAMSDLVGYLTENCCDGTDCRSDAAQPVHLDGKETP